MQCQIQTTHIPIGSDGTKVKFKIFITMKTSRKKWFPTLKEAKSALAERLPYDHTLQIFKGVRGSRHPKEYFVGHYIEFINIY